MKRALKWSAIVLASLAGLLLIVIGAIYLVSNARFNHNYDIDVESVEIPSDQTSIDYGEHVATIFACKECHGENLAGRIEFEDPLVGRIANANLTTGAGGIGFEYTDHDWIRAIRHGVDPDGRPLLVMPATTLYPMSDEDLGSVIAYVKSVQPVDNKPLGVKLNLLPRVMFLAGQMDFLLPAEMIDHEGPRPVAPTRGISAEYGQYLAGLCTICHGPGFSGGRIPGTPPDDPPALNLTPGGALADWTADDFIKAMRTGITPTGRELPNEFMPWQLYDKMTDEELEALWTFLRSLPPGEYGNR